MFQRRTGAVENKQVSTAPVFFNIRALAFIIFSSVDFAPLIFIFVKTKH